MTITRYSMTNPSSGPVAMVMSAVLAIVGGAILLRDPATMDTFHIGFTLFWFLVLGLATYRQFTAAREIVVHENDQVEFVSWAGSVQVAARDIQSVKARQGRYGLMTVRHTGGTVNLAGNFDRLHLFLSELETANPAVRISGC
jgi:hypothetical protein